MTIGKGKRPRDPVQLAKQADSYAPAPKPRGPYKKRQESV